MTHLLQLPPTVVVCQPQRRRPVRILSRLRQLSQRGERPKRTTSLFLRLFVYHTVSHPSPIPLHCHFYWNIRIERHFMLLL